MEPLSILMDKYIKDVSVQRKFMAFLGGFVVEDEYVEEKQFLEELEAFVKENPDVTLD